MDTSQNDEVNVKAGECGLKRSIKDSLGCVHIHWGGAHEALERIVESNGFTLDALPAIVPLEDERWEIAVNKTRVGEFCHKHPNLRPSLAGPNERLLRPYSELQRSKTSQLQDLINEAGEYEFSGHSNALFPLSTIVKDRCAVGDTIITLEGLEHRAIKWYEAKGMKLGFECLHVALVRRQGENFCLDGEDLGVLLDWVFHETDVLLILGQEDYVCKLKTVEEVMDRLFQQVELETGCEGDGCR
ncbi:hypothetical protein ACJ73_00062 [Blastomyces percursus]|uniref:Uncharacterized protein n=1 Tax=Blastomyces percursus TaxID=1658174 RepID=A0A1J9RJ28_9EURO|nr:hypothetical protein ACJ73_00062 [Blastomyces percursus]